VVPSGKRPHQRARGPRSSFRRQRERRRSGGTASPRSASAWRRQQMGAAHSSDRLGDHHSGRTSSTPGTASRPPSRARCASGADVDRTAPMGRAYTWMASVTAIAASLSASLCVGWAWQV
jgi:hypothetical protein